ncbi:hypothetical protein V1290_007369 [Bradyrhizobium sp. AZCC 1578]|uniref:hypothetical protein n=1 Tax=Bradyrhizobium sp. AZCC 1578 TaxID=3117027 RepID=UPI002FEED41E
MRKKEANTATVRPDRRKYEAPAGSSKLDSEVDRINRQRNSKADPLRTRQGLWRAALHASLTEEDLGPRPQRINEAKKYLKSLNAVRRHMIAASQADTELVYRALVFVPDDPSDSSQLLSRQAVERDFLQLNADLRHAHDLLSKYLNRNVLPGRNVPPSTQSSNAADHFTRAFVDMARAVWRDEFGDMRGRDDPTNFSTLIATALEEFGYPQQSASHWLKFKERVRKQIRPNRRKRSIRK